MTACSRLQRSRSRRNTRAHPLRPPRGAQPARTEELLLSTLARIAPEIAANWPAYRDLAATSAGAEQRRENVSEVWAWIGSHNVARRPASRLFSDVQIAAVPTLMEQTADELNAVLRTLSFYRRLSPNQRQALQSETAAIYKRLGRPNPVEYRRCTRHGTPQHRDLSRRPRGCRCARVGAHSPRPLETIATRLSTRAQLGRDFRNTPSKAGVSPSSADAPPPRPER